MMNGSCLIGRVGCDDTILYVELMYNAATRDVRFNTTLNTVWLT